MCRWRWATHVCMPYNHSTMYTDFTMFGERKHFSLSAKASHLSLVGLLSKLFGDFFTLKYPFFFLLFQNGFLFEFLSRNASRSSRSASHLFLTFVWRILDSFLSFLQNKSHKISIQIKHLFIFSCYSRFIITFQKCELIDYLN